MCKHVAAVLYGVGARLDHKPELLFALRGVDHEELIAADAEAAVSATTASGASKRLAVGELSAVFGIDLDAAGAEQPSPAAPVQKTAKPRSKTAKEKAGKKPAAAKKTTKKAKAKKPPKQARTKKAP
jgi:uncharacterized Zn finger protein